MILINNKDLNIKASGISTVGLMYHHITNITTCANNADSDNTTNTAIFTKKSIIL